MKNDVLLTFSALFAVSLGAEQIQSEEPSAHVVFYSRDTQSLFKLNGMYKQRQLRVH